MTAVHSLQQRIRAATRLLRLAPVLDARGHGRRKRSLSEAARILNANGIPAPRGGQWAHPQVRHALAQIARDMATLQEWQQD